MQKKSIFYSRSTSAFKPIWLLETRTEPMGLQLLNEKTSNPLNFDWNFNFKFQTYWTLALNPKSKFYFWSGSLSIYYVV